MTEKVYSRDEEEYVELGDFIDRLEGDGDLVPGTVIYEADKVERRASYYLHSPADTITEAMADAAWDDAGEFADTWPDLPLAKKMELEALLKKWLDDNVPVTFWTAHNSKHIELTAEWIAENTATVPSSQPNTP